GGDFDAGAQVNTIETGIGPISAKPGDEDTQCITINLKNPEGAFVRRFRTELGEGSHHMILYTTNATTESPVPQKCGPLSGVFPGGAGVRPVFIAQQAKSDLVFPTDENGVPVGLEIKPNQMVRIEMHFIDTTSNPLPVT